MILRCLRDRALPVVAVLWLGGLQSDASDGETHRSARRQGVPGPVVYVWDRVTDLLDVVRCGVSLGPAAGAEVSLGEPFVLGAHASREAGVTFPHCVPFLWPLTDLDGGEVFSTHAGQYATWVAGEDRRQSSLRRDVRFPRRATGEVRMQAGLGLGQLFVSLDLWQAGDFLMGIVGEDPMGDDLAEDR